MHASQLYARNVVELLKLIVKDGKFNLDFNDEIIKGACVTHNGRDMRAAPHAQRPPLSSLLAAPAHRFHHLWASHAASRVSLIVLPGRDLFAVPANHFDVLISRLARGHAYLRLDLHDVTPQ